MKKIQVNNISLAYERRGTGTPLLLVHGFPLDHSTWQPLFTHLEPDFDLLLPDLRGFGQSDAPAGAYTVAQMAADLAALLDTLGFRKTCIVGHSMGGYVTLAFANAYPERVLGMGLIGSQAVADSAERKAGRITSARQVELEGVGALAGMAEKLSANPDHTPFFREIILRQRAQGMIGALHAIADRPDGSALLAEANTPLVLVHGLADALIPVERSREMKALQPQALFIELPGVGHSPAMEAPIQTAQALQTLRINHA